jgi:hypothetical protein
MKRRILGTLALVSLFTSFTALTVANAETEIRYAGSNTYYLVITDDAGNELAIAGTQDQLKTRVEQLQQEALQLAAQVQLGDGCRTTICYKLEVNATTGEEKMIPLTEEEILAREIEVAQRAIRVQSFVSAAGSDYASRAEAIYAIPISAGGSTQTIQGTQSQIAEQIQKLRAEADSYRNSVDPCAIETCYKTIVDLHWGLAPATTTTIPLTAEDLAQRAIDRQNQATRAEAVANAAESGAASPVHTLSVSTPNSSFGTSGTRDQLAATVAQLREQANQAAANASNLANNPIVERHLIVDLHWGLAPATETIIEKTLTGAERDQRISDANNQAAQAEALAAAAEQALSEIP